MLIWTIVSSWKFSPSVVVSWLFLRGSAEITGSSTMRSGRFAEWSHKWKHPRIHQHSFDRRDSTRSQDAFLLAEPCRFISVFRCWDFFDMSIHFYTERLIFRVAFVRGFQSASNGAFGLNWRMEKHAKEWAGYPVVILFCQYSAHRAPQHANPGFAWGVFCFSLNKTNLLFFSYFLGFLSKSEELVSLSCLSIPTNRSAEGRVSRLGSVQASNSPVEQLSGPNAGGLSQAQKSMFRRATRVE